MEKLVSQFNSITIEDINLVSEQISKIINSYKIKYILLEGSLGSGKTTLLKSLIPMFNSQISSKIIKSNTFGYISTYSDSDKESIHHIDLYRVESIEKLIRLDLIREDGLYFIEWGKIAKSLLERYLLIEIDLVGLNRNFNCFIKDSN